LEHTFHITVFNKTMIPCKQYQTFGIATPSNFQVAQLFTF